MHEEDIERLIESREAGGPFRSLEDLAARAEPSATPRSSSSPGPARATPRSAPASKPGAPPCGNSGSRAPRKRARAATSSRSSSPSAEAPELPALSDWEAMIADYDTHRSIDRPSPPRATARAARPAKAPSRSPTSPRSRTARHVKVGGLRDRPPETRDGQGDHISVARG